MAHTINPLSAEKLRASWPADRIPWESTAAIPRNFKPRPAQPRALAALELALHIKTTGYNIYLAGEPNLGRTYTLKEFLAPRARKEATPPDLLYVHNFDNPDKPRLLQVPAGQGSPVKKALAAALTQIRKELPSRFEAEAYIKKRGDMLDKFQAVRARVLKEMDKVAGGQGFNLDVDEQGSLTLYPLVEGKRLSEEEFDKLDAELRQTLKRKGDSLLHAMTGLARKLAQAERDFKTDEKKLDREETHIVLERVFTPMVEKVARNWRNTVHGRGSQNGQNAHTAPTGTSTVHNVDTRNMLTESHFEALMAHLERIRADILDNPETILPRDILPPFERTAEKPPFEPWPIAAPEPDLPHYGINLFVDNSGVKGAPLVSDDHPTFANLLGSIEREAEMGALVTDFTLIKPGSLHKANGGYLVLHIEDILQHPAAWEGLIRALRGSIARIEDASEGDGAKTKGIEPEPLPLALKVILVGPDDIYESLLMGDDRFPKLFRIKAQMTSSTPRNAQNVRAWLPNLARIADEANLLPFDRHAMAALVDYASKLCEDHKKISLKFPLIREAMIEAAALATMKKPGAELVTGEHVEQALAGQVYRTSLIEELFLEEYDRDLIKIETAGTAVGRITGLSVTFSGDFEFGLPHQISCTVGVGHGGIIDLEREAELGGPIHTKAMLILKSYLLDQFAHNKPLVLTGSLCFEQSYSGIEGDSASGAELACLLSAISGVPVRLTYAFTGAVSQAGDILAVGGVTRKIEGFFELCKRRGLTGEQGVIIPADNVPHLMLNNQVIHAVKEGKFAIYPITHISQALELLTGMPTGKRNKSGSFTKGSLFEKVDDKLHELGYLAEHSFKIRKTKKSAK